MDLLDIMDLPYPQSPGFRNTDTSFEAAASINASGLRAKVLRVVAQAPCTADEAASILDIDRLAIRPRLTELKALGKVRDTGERRPNASGRSAIVWAIAA